MIKPSEYTPATSQAMAELIAGAFDELEISVLVGGPQTGADFAGLPFDHLLFTGATSVARHVMRAAADNLVPVTLELGGKSPVIVGRSADIDKTTDAIMAGKMMNAGQICLAPDYVFVPKENVGEFVESTQRSVKKMFRESARERRLHIHRQSAPLRSPQRLRRRRETERRARGRNQPGQ